MRRLWCVITVGFVLAAVAYFQLAQAAPAPRDAPAAKWEYKTLTVWAHKDNEEALNKLGEEGWEFAGFGGEAITNGAVKQSLLVFKRLKK